MTRLAYPNKEKLKKYLQYDKHSGEFTWVKGHRLGKKAGSVNNGYITIKLHQKAYQAHILAWIYVYGESPHLLLDHVDRNGLNNKIDNLRSATVSQNCANKAHYNKHGLKGIGFDKRHGKWYANIQINKKQTRLGTFKTKEEAHEAYMKAAKNIHGEFASDGKRV